MKMTRLVVLANSWKHSDWCIAGINLDTGAWVRPVSDLPDGRIPKSAMKLDGYFPQLLDVVELPLADGGPDYGFEKENRSLLPGAWQRHGKLSPLDLLQYAVAPGTGFHNEATSVPLALLQAKPFDQRDSLQLVLSDSFRARRARCRATGEPTWQGIVRTDKGELAIRITDPVFVGMLNAGHTPERRCLLTLSLSMPYAPPEAEVEVARACWKLIAGVVALPPCQAGE